MKKTLTEQEGIVRLVDEQLSGRLLEKLLHVVFLHPLDRFSPGRCLQRAQVARIVLHSQTYLCVSGRMERPKKNHDLLSCAAVRTISAGAHRKLPPRQRLLELLRHLLPTKVQRQTAGGLPGPPRYRRKGPPQISNAALRCTFSEFFTARESCGWQPTAPWSRPCRSSNERGERIFPPPPCTELSLSL